MLIVHAMIRFWNLMIIFSQFSVRNAINYHYKYIMVTLIQDTVGLECTVCIYQSVFVCVCVDRQTHKHGDNGEISFQLTAYKKAMLPPRSCFLVH